MNNIITIPAHISRISTMADRTVRLQVDVSRELTDEDMAVLFGFRNVDGSLAFKEGKFSDEELALLPDYKPEFKDEKTPSSRMRSVMFRLWEVSGQTLTFEQYYREQMEIIINHLKGKLP